MLGEGTLLKGTEKISVDQVLSVGPKILMFYFSMHTCPPCRKFTPLLNMIYEECNEDSKQFEVIFCSGDGKEELFIEYFKEMLWVALPWRDPRIKAIAKEFKVKGLP